MPGLLRRVRTTLTIASRRRVRGLLDGEYASVFHGRSLEFDDLRPYVPGDEVKDIDWKATARLGGLMTRRYVAQRKHTILLVVDTGRAMAALAASGESKRDVAILAAGTLGYIAQHHGDLVGLVTGDAHRTELVRAASTEAHLERMLQRIHDRTTLDADRSDLAAHLAYVQRVVRTRAVLVVIADDRPLTEAETDAVRRLVVRHEVLWVTVGDADLVADDLGDDVVADVESDVAIPAVLRHDRRLAAEFAASVAATAVRTRDVLDSLGVASTRVTSSAEVVPALFRVLEAHRHARR